MHGRNALVVLGVDVIDYEKLKEEYERIGKKMVEDHSETIEQNIKDVLIKYDLEPSQIELRVMPEFKYSVYVKAAEFEIKQNFIITGG